MSISRYSGFSRRQLLSGGARIAGGIAVGGGLAACADSAGQEASDGLAARLDTLTTRDALRRPGHFFSIAQFRLLERISDLIMPETDTPGALAAGVPQLIDRMMVTWALPETRSDWLAGLAAIDARARREHGVAFARLEPDTQFDVLSRHDGEALSASDRAYRQMKSTIVEAYYCSEPGATEELRYDPVPGPYRGCVPFDEIGRTWAT
ncbi:gluconate 2-dehydrogenase subunit 3 family protein [Aquisalinus flavus]|uniref:Gluconate 2-dehydrogenase subunit 3 family protein n=1 Tax=Aquisalinus flavus TaxID=1526572 RepID=A0A8J2V3I8_9PROT|nr:gluconate 2-dehydrogenase subunit 3 family protein [Aquisalinus flavus]MBD0425769.1 gluconate 2-dehydrogenase subunit 3 family protein [Aquisalinus flavus]UNE48623.1 gluconate 2-dehydrogenase subunit 3 family protein [Aquisalinus flavus]GGD13454.1 hypothetical protein GCM10011342_22740 [Aquisalinus flavus]